MNPDPTQDSAEVRIGEDGAARFALNGGRVALDRLDGALGKPVRVSLSDGVLARIDAGAEAVRRIAGGDKPAYGINTGFGHLCQKRISPDEVEALQRNLVISHAVGVGPPAPAEVVRWMLLFKIQALLHGVSGVRRTTVEMLCRLLDADALPVIPTQGSLGASGDLAPLAHMVRPIIGEGTIQLGGRELPARGALAKLDLEPITLGPKEGLGLINGTQFMSAYAAVIALRARRLIRHVDVIATMSLEGIGGSIRPSDERLHQLRPHAGAMEVAENLRRLMRDSEVLQSHVDCNRVQDPYSLRCVPQVHGASRDALRHAWKVIETEINSVTDNPLIFGEEVISGGSFHGQPLALVLDYVGIALAELASISERRIYLLLSGVAGLPALLMEHTGLNSGFMLPQYTAAALVSENKLLASPASVDSIPTSLGQEDHVSMGATAATKCLRILENTETVLAIEQMCAAQALDFRLPLKPGVGPRAAHAEIRRKIPHADADRPFGEDIQRSLELLRSQSILTAAARETGDLL